MTFFAVVFIVIGVGMIGFWAFAFFSHQIPEVQSEPVRIGFHICAEVITGICLIAGGTGSLLDVNWAASVNLFGSGMLAYTAIISPGYYAQQKKWAMVVLFAGVLLIAISYFVFIV